MRINIKATLVFLVLSSGLALAGRDFVHYAISADRILSNSEELCEHWLESPDLKYRWEVHNHQPRFKGMDVFQMGGLDLVDRLACDVQWTPEGWNDMPPVWFDPDSDLVMWRMNPSNQAGRDCGFPPDASLVPFMAVYDVVTLPDDVGCIPYQQDWRNLKDDGGLGVYEATIAAFFPNGFVHEKRYRIMRVECNLDRGGCR